MTSTEDALRKALGNVGVTRVRLEPPEKAENHRAELLGQLLGHVFIGAWFLMLGMGAASRLWPVVIPAADYWTCVLLMLGLSALQPMKRRWFER